MTRNFDLFENQNGGLISFGSEKNETINGVSDYKVSANNNYKYSNKVLEYLNGAFSNPNITSNGLAAFFVKGKSLPNSLWQAYTNNNSIFKSVFDLNYFVMQNYQNNWATDDVVLSTTRDITLMKSPSISFSIDLGLNLDFNFGYKSWNNYNHNYKEAIFSKSLGKKLITLDMPDIYSNLEIPQTEPMGYFWNKVQLKVFALLPPIAQNAYNFVRDISRQASNEAQIIFSNFSNQFGTRSLMNGQVIYDSESKNPTLTANVPSVFTFAINPSPQVFNANTSLRFKYYYPENEIKAITTTDTMQIVSDVFFLEAKDGTAVLNQAPNGNFSIATQFSLDDLKLASLPLNSVAVVLFLPNGSNVWENIGSANQTISFNRLGVFALGVKIVADNVAPTIAVTAPTNFVSPNVISVELNDNQSGIDWAKSIFSCNSVNIPISRVGTTNTFNVPISSLPPNSDNVFTITILTYDFAGNSNSFSQTYPCISELTIHSLSDEIINPITQKASKFIYSDSKMPDNNDVIYKAGNSILLQSGFETKTKTFKAEIRGCDN